MVQSGLLLRRLDGEIVLPPSIKTLFSCTAGDCGENPANASLSSSFIGVAGTVMLRSYAWTTLSAASTARLALSVESPSVIYQHDYIYMTPHLGSSQCFLSGRGRRHHSSRTVHQ